MTKYRPVLLAASSYSIAFSGQTAASTSRCNVDLAADSQNLTFHALHSIVQHAFNAM